MAGLLGFGRRAGNCACAAVGVARAQAGRRLVYADCVALNVARAQAGLLGFWGEWHTYPHSKWFASEATQRRVLGAFDRAFNATPVMTRSADGVTTDYEVRWSATEDGRESVERQDRPMQCWRERGTRNKMKARDVSAHHNHDHYQLCLTVVTFVAHVRVVISQAN